MEKVQPQRTELYEYLHTYMEELFQDLCRAVQTILDIDSAKIWEHFQDEQVRIRQNYAAYYDSLPFQMIKALTGLILETVEESGVHAADSLRIICGDYMDHAVVLYAHGHPEEACQQKLTGARRASRGR